MNISKHADKSTEQLKAELDGIQVEIDKYRPDQAKTHALKLLKKERAALTRRLAQIRKQEKLLKVNPQEGVIAPESIKIKAEMGLMTEAEYAEYKAGRGAAIPATWAAESQSVLAWKSFEKVIEKCATKTQIMAIIQKYLEIVERGDSWAMVDFLNRWFGKPTEKHEVTLESINMDPKQKIAEINVILGLTTPPEPQKQFPTVEDIAKQMAEEDKKMITVIPEENKDVNKE